MMPAMYSAISGLQAHQTMLDVTANNLANVDTIGFKAQRTTFVNELSELLSSGSGSSAAGTSGGTNPEQIGLGVQVGSIDNIMNAGSLQNTGNTLDVAIQGDGFLCTSSIDPVVDTAAATNLPVQYTRAGNLTTTPETLSDGTSVGVLTTSQGRFVLGSATPGDQTSTPPVFTDIEIPAGATNVSIGQDGSVNFTKADGTSGTAGYIALASFPNESGLLRGAGSTWSASLNSGPALVGTPNTGSFTNSQIIAGELEQSNVDMSTEFTNMIEAQRGYQANSSVISTADQMMQTLIQMAQAG